MSPRIVRMQTPRRLLELELERLEEDAEAVTLLWAEFGAEWGDRMTVALEDRRLAEMKLRAMDEGQR